MPSQALRSEVTYLRTGTQQSGHMPWRDQASRQCSTSALDRLRLTHDMFLVESFAREVADGRLHPLGLGLSPRR
jgi:hypothetical protein